MTSQGLVSLCARSTPSSSRSRGPAADRTLDRNAVGSSWLPREPPRKAKVLRPGRNRSSWSAAALSPTKASASVAPLYIDRLTSSANGLTSTGM